LGLTISALPEGSITSGKKGYGLSRMSDSQRSDLSHFAAIEPPRRSAAMVKQAGIELPDELMQQFITAWPRL